MLHPGLLTQAAEIGAVISPPHARLYTRPEFLLEIVEYAVYRLLDCVAWTWRKATSAAGPAGAPRGRASPTRSVEYAPGPGADCDK